MNFVVPPRLERLEVRLKPCDELRRTRAVAVARGTRTRPRGGHGPAAVPDAEVAAVRRVRRREVDAARVARRPGQRDVRVYVEPVGMH